MLSNSVSVVTSELATLTILAGPQPSNSHPALIARWPWTIRDFGYVDVVASRGRYAYGLARGGRFVIFDARNPTLLHPVGALNLEGNPRHITLTRSHAFISAGVAGLHVVDIRDPSCPRPVARWPDGNATSATVKGETAFVTDYSEGLSLIDISDPAKPRRVGWFRTGGSASVSVSRNLAYVASGPGLTVLNVHDPKAPRLVKRISLSDAKSVIVAEHLAFVASGRGFKILDVSHPQQPRKLSHFDSGRGAADGMTYQDGYVFIVDDDGIVQVVNVSNPAVPVRVGVFWTSRAEAYNIAVSGPYLYLADTSGLHLLNLAKLGVAPRALPPLQRPVKPSQFQKSLLPRW